MKVTKKGHQLLQSHFLSPTACFLSVLHAKSAVIEYLDVTVLLESFDPTALLEYFGKFDNLGRKIS